jgi:hypothetical protein
MPGPKQLGNLRVSAQNITSSISALHVSMVDSSGGFLTAPPGSTQVSVQNILTSSGASVMDSTNNSLGVTIRAGSAAGTEYTDGDVDATVSGGAILFDNSSNTLRSVTITRGLPVNVVAGAAGGSTQVSVKEILTSSGASLMDSTNTALRVNVVAGSAAGSTEVTIRQSTFADLNGLFRLADRDASTNVANITNTTPASTAYALAVRQVGFSTTVQVSSLGGAVIVRSSAADCAVTASQGGTWNIGTVTTITGVTTVSSLAGVVRIAGNNAADGIVHVGDSTNAALRVNVVAGSAAGSTVTSVSQLLDSSGGSIAAGDSANNALRVNVVAGAAAGSTEVTVRQSTYTDFNALSRLADRDASTQVANITNTTPASTAYGLVVREATRLNFATDSVAIIGTAANNLATVYQSTVGALRASVYQSTAADLQATVAQASTVWAAQVSSVGGIVTVNNNDGSGNALASAISTPSTNARGLVVRPVVNGINSTTVLITSTNSTAIYSLISSVAGARQKVFAYFVGSTHTNPSTLVFVSSNVIDRWAVNFGSGSSGITGANLALSPPAWLFATDAANALNVRVEGGSSAASTVLVRVSFSWFSEA